MAIVYPAIPPRSGEVEKFYQAIVQQLSYHKGSGTPVSTVLPRFIGDRYLDASASDWYISYGLGITNWKKITP